MNPEDVIIGIDLGTTNSVVSVIRDGEVEIVREGDQELLPSVVGVDDSGHTLVGAPARNQLLLAPDRTVKSIKRKMGEDTTVVLGEQSYRPQEISAIILRTLKERAERHLGHEVKKAVITVPAFFNDSQRDATREAGELADLEVVRIINEPTAASLTYEFAPEGMERLLVYDLGGGTFDVSIVQVEQGVVEVLSSHGDTRLGGDDFDNLLLDSVCDDFQKEHGVDLRENPTARSRLLQAVEAAKIRLSSEPVTRLEEEFIAEKDGVALHIDKEISRFDYEAMIRPLLDTTLTCVDDAMDDAKVKANEINKVILVGGASRTPVVHRLLEEKLGQPLHSEVHPDLAVAMGAAIQGAMIGGVDMGPVLVDITPHTLGVRCVGDMRGFPSSHVFSSIIERNTPLPAMRSEMYYTMHDGQERVNVEVYQGEDEDVRHNEYVGEVLLEGLADVSQGNEIVVQFKLDLNGILNVAAVERATGLEKDMVIDNAMHRFRQHNREDAKTRLKGLFSDIQTAAAPGAAAGAPAPSPHADLPEALREKVLKAEDLLTKSKRAASGASKEDAEEIREISTRLQKAIDDRNEKELDVATAKLEDLVFYLEDF